jgi:hypothetical protein
MTRRRALLDEDGPSEVASDGPSEVASDRSVQKPSPPRGSTSVTTPLRTKILELSILDAMNSPEIWGAWFEDKSS